MSDYHPPAHLTIPEIDYIALLDAVSEIVLVLDEDGVIRYISAPVELVLGYTPAECLGEMVWNRIHPDDVSLLRSKMARCISGEASSARVLEIRGSHRDGSWRCLEIRSAPAKTEGARATIFIARDLTEEREAEEQLHQAQRMEAVGLLASGVAHDFNNLLTGIRGYTDLLLHDLPTGDPRRRDIEEIREAAYRATSLTRQLLTFSRRQDLEPQILDPAEVVAGLDRLLQRLIDENIEIRSTFGQRTGWVAADRNQLEQVIINLAVNARDAMPNGGVLEIEVGNLVLDEESAPEHPPLEPGGYVLISVSDTGSGIDEETRRQIFEPLFTTKDPGKGTGLGLSTVEAIARRSGGTITVESAPGKGSTFKVILPRVQIDMVDEVPVTAQHGPDPGEMILIEPESSISVTILLVEDEEVVRNLAQRVLERKGYHVLTAGDGEEALQVAGRYPKEIDLLITDVIMPRLGGAGLARELVRIRPGTRVLFISGHPGDELDVDEIDGERFAFLEKPFSPERLTREVRRLLRSKQIQHA